MAASRIFYVVQGELSVHSAAAGASSEPLSFADNDDGLRAFDAYVAEHPHETTAIVVDVIEEVFLADSVPAMGHKDRLHLLDRRLQRKFPRTPFCLSSGAGNSLSRAERAVVYSAISNHELLDPWIAGIVAARVPLVGIRSVPLMTPQVLRRLFARPGAVLYVTQHQGDKLRQTFVQGGLVKSSRLSQSPAVADAAYPGFVATEIQRSRRYLERTRLMTGAEPLDICIVSDLQICERVIKSISTDSPLRFHLFDLARTVRKCRARRTPEIDQLQDLFIDAAMQNTAGHNYATAGEDRYWHMSRMRRAIIGATSALAAAASIIAGIYLGDAWRLHGESATIDSQVRQLSETYRRENDHTGGVRADSYEMKLAVDTGDYILRQRVPAPWVMYQLGTVLSDYPDVRLSHLSWHARSDTQMPPQRARPGEPATPIPIPELSSVTAEITATIEPFEGQLRDAFRRIDELAASIRGSTAFSETVVVAYPVDASVQASVSGEISREISGDTATFRLQLKYPLAAAPASEVSDDAI